jgi:hypothetical protein
LETKANPPKKKPSILVASIIIICFCASAVLVPIARRQNPQPAVAAVTEKPSAVPQPTETPLPPAAPALIPNIQPADVTLNLEERFGMTCGDVEFGVDYNIRTCEKAGILRADVYGRELFSVDFIEAGYVDITPNLETAKAYMSFVASLPFIGDEASQQLAMDWVASEITLSKVNKETDINGIHFYLLNSPTFIVLSIGDLK